MSGSFSARSGSDLRGSIAGAQASLAAAADRLDRLLSLDRVTVDTWQDAAADVGTSMAEARRHLETINGKLGCASATEALLKYFQTRVGEVVTGAQLEGVAAISSWSRRVRELGEKHGRPIDSGVERVELRPDKYMLTSLNRK